MTLDALHAAWATDSDLDTSRLDQSIRDIPLLHAKWWKIYTDERQRYMLAKQDRDDVLHARRDWYLGRLDDEERVKRNWPHQHLRLVRQDVDVALTTDAELRPLNAKVEVAELKLKFIEDLIKSINFRANLVKTYVDYLRFSNGS